MAVKTRLTLAGYGGKRCGSFVGKSQDQNVTLPRLTVAGRVRQQPVAARARVFTIPAREKT